MHFAHLAAVETGIWAVSVVLELSGTKRFGMHI